MRVLKKISRTHPGVHLNFLVLSAAFQGPVGVVTFAEL